MRLVLGELDSFGEDVPRVKDGDGGVDGGREDWGRGGADYVRGRGGGDQRKGRSQGCEEKEEEAENQRGEGWEKGTNEAWAN